MSAKLAHRFLNVFRLLSVWPWLLTFLYSFAYFCIFFFCSGYFRKRKGKERNFKDARTRERRKGGCLRVSRCLKLLWEVLMQAIRDASHKWFSSFVHFMVRLGMYVFVYILIEYLSKFASNMERAWITQRGRKISLLYAYIDVYIKVGFYTMTLWC